MDWFPKHEAGLSLEHNEHKNVYMCIEDYYPADQFISEDDRQKCIDTNEVWRLHWYPETPIGFHVICASSIDLIQKQLKEKTYD